MPGKRGGPSHKVVEPGGLHHFLWVLTGPWPRKDQIAVTVIVTVSR